MSASTTELSASALSISVFSNENTTQQHPPCHYHLVIFVRHLIDVLSRFLSSPKSSLWELRYLGRWKGTIFLHSPSLSSHFIKDAPYSEFTDLFEKYKSWKELSSDQEARKKLNAYLRHGCCYASCVRLLRLQEESPEALPEDLLPEFKNKLDTLAYDQILELFRNVFESYQDSDSLEKVREVLPQPQRHKKAFNCSFPKNRMARALSRYEDQVLFLHVWNGGRSHVISLRVCSNKNFFYFFNSSGGGLYSFSSQEKLITCFVSHLHSHVSFSRKNASWEIESYPIK